MENALNSYIATNATGGESFSDESTDNNSNLGWAFFDLNFSLLLGNSPDTAKLPCSGKCMWINSITIA